jgi:hypothetical protein
MQGFENPEPGVNEERKAALPDGRAAKAPFAAQPATALQPLNNMPAQVNNLVPQKRPFSIAHPAATTRLCPPPGPAPCPPAFQPTP